MATLDEFRREAAEVRNWGRWGDDDELGTLNHISAEKVLQAASLVRRGAVFPLGVNLDSQGPQGATPFRGNPIHLMIIDGGDAADYVRHVRGWGHAAAEAIGAMYEGGLMRFADDYITMPLQAATQWDALAHVWYDDQIYNGFASTSVTSFGATRCGIEKIDVKGITSRGVLLDLARHRGVPSVEHGAPIEPEELDAVARGQGVTIGRGDIVLIRTGWWGAFLAAHDPLLEGAGLSWRCARWLNDLEVAAVAADNAAVENFRDVQVESVLLPLHCLCLRDMGMTLGEFWNLEALAADCAADGIWEFQLVASPLKVTGGVGSPVNPIALK